MMQAVNSQNEIEKVSEKPDDDASEVSVSMPSERLGSSERGRNLVIGNATRKILN